MVVRHEECWAKTTPSDRPGISVHQHCRTAGIVAQLLAVQCPAWLRESLAMQEGVVLAAIHDIGKVCPGFQAKCATWLQSHALPVAELAGAETDHGKVSQRTIQEALGRDELRFWAAIVGAHHGRLKGDRVPSLCDGGEEWAFERRRLVLELIAQFGPLPDRPPVRPDCAELWFNAGLIVVADWLASDDRTFPPSKVLDSEEIRQRADEQLERIGFRPFVCPSGKAFTDLFHFPANPLQAVFAEAVRAPGVYVVEASMGSGKTEAALMAAYSLLSTGQATGIYFALPTQVTSNRIHKRVQSFIEQFAPGSGTRLIHGNSWLIQTEAQNLTGSANGASTPEWTARDWFASPRRALLAPFGVGTVDQALLGVIAAKHFFVRQFALAGKVVILDEVHSYDLYTGTLLDQLVTRLRELDATVIILSATLTAARREKLLGVREVATGGRAYPLLSAQVGGERLEWPVDPEEPKTIHVHFVPPSDLTDTCLARAEAGQCVLWIRNTVSDAQETYRQLLGRNCVGGSEIALLHARFPQFRREQLEGEWLDRLGKDPSKRPSKGCVLVSTQVAEQSVDIDADLLITDLAPTDMLLQRIGRLWRHPRQRPEGCTAPRVWISTPSMDLAGLRTAAASAIKAVFGRSARVYAPYVLLRTLAVWNERTVVTLPTDIRELLEATYADFPANEPAAWMVLRKELEKEKDKLRQSALANGNPWQVPLDDKEDVQTRWSSCPTGPVLIVQDNADLAWHRTRGSNLTLLNGDTVRLRPGVFEFSAAQALHRNMVKVPLWSVRERLRSTPDWLRQYFHDGLLACKSSEGKLVCLPGGADCGLTYRDDLGVAMPQPQGGGPPREQNEEYDDESYD